MSKTTQQLILEPIDNNRLAVLCGQNDENLLMIEADLEVSITNRGGEFILSGKKTAIFAAVELLEQLYAMTETASYLAPNDISLMLHSKKTSQPAEKSKEYIRDIEIQTKRGLIKGRNANQKRYLTRIEDHDINFGVGPAGTGKTYLAVACAVQALQKEMVRRIVLVRPAVEAGERLGFLPGDLSQKVDPYLRPLYDALYEMLGFEQVEKLMDKNIIEVAPLAYMRGRTLNNAFIILDESQNTTKEQMKMFLTRMGFGSKTVITGDITQIDLQQNQRSGLLHIIDVLKEIPGFSFTFFEPKDVVRHPLVQAIVEAYDKYREPSTRKEK